MSSSCSASGELLGRRPANLSGGEKQRVAIGRALLARPRLLVMDEPLAALDEARKAEILPYIERLRDEAGVPIIYVSHAIAEVARLATTLVVLSEGRVAAVGPTASVMGRIDLFPMTGRAEAGAILATRIAAQDAAFGLTVLRAAAGELRVPHLEMPVGSALRVRIRARDVMIALAPPEGLSALNVLPGTVAEIGRSEGAIVDIRLDCAGEPLIARLTRRSVERLGSRTGTAASTPSSRASPSTTTPSPAPRRSHPAPMPRRGMGNRGRWAAATVDGAGVPKTGPARWQSANDQNI